MHAPKEYTIQISYAVCKIVQLLVTTRYKKLMPWTIFKYYNTK